VTSYSRQTFSYAGPHAWNSLLEHLRQPHQSNFSSAL